MPGDQVDQQHAFGAKACCQYRRCVARGNVPQQYDHLRHPPIEFGGFPHRHRKFLVPVHLRCPAYNQRPNDRGSDYNIKE